MRTLVIVHSLKMGGMERVAVNLADAFAAEGHDSHLLSCRRRPNDLHPSDPRVHVHHWDQRRNLLRSGIGVPVYLVSRLLIGPLVRKSHFISTGWLMGWLLARHIRKLEARHGRFDRIVFRGLGTYKYFWTLRDARNLYVLENVIHHDRPRWQKKLEWRLVFHRRHLVCVSESVRESAREAFAIGGVEPLSLRVITNPCPIEQIRELMLEDDPDIPRQPYLVNVARLVPQKGHELLLDAYARANPPQKLVLVGDGPLRDDLERRTRVLGISDRVIFAGQRLNPYPWMHRADLFVLTSVFEGLGIVLTESLACGTPILASEGRGGVRDVCRGELARYLAPAEPNALAARLREVLAELPIEVKPEWLDPYRSEVIVERFLEPPATDASRPGT